VDRDAVFATEVRRLKENSVVDPAALTAVLAVGRVAHVGLQLQGLPYVLPVAYAPASTRNEETPALLLHGSTGSRLFRAAAAGAPCAVTITVLDGLVLARSAFESSMHYRCAMLFGSCHSLEGSEKVAALETLTDHLLPGRRAHLRPPSPKELAATSVLRLTTRQWSLKVSTGFADDPDDDVRSQPDLWAGVVPLQTRVGPAIPDPASRHMPPPAYLDQWQELFAPTGPDPEPA